MPKLAEISPKIEQSETKGHLVTSQAEALLEALVTTCRSYELPFDDARPAHVEVDAGIGHVLWLAVEDGLRFRVTARGSANAVMLRESVHAHVDAFDSDLASGIQWSGPLPAAGLPPNFRIGRIASVAPLGDLFWRVVIAAPNLRPFARDGLHFRLALPPRGHEPAWPRLHRSGRIDWPAGPDALHVAVYTIREVDPAASTLTVDAFRHGRGPTCAWLAEAREGDAIGFIGPGGGWLPAARHLTLAGDETALPAIARIVEAAPEGTTGTVLIETATGGGIPMVAASSGLSVRVLSRAANECLEDALADVDLGPEGERHVWFAAEKSRAAAMRRYLDKVRGVVRGERYAAGYWSEI